MGIHTIDGNFAVDKQTRHLITAPVNGKGKIFHNKVVIDGVKKVRDTGEPTQKIYELSDGCVLVDTRNKIITSSG